MTQSQKYQIRRRLFFVALLFLLGCRQPTTSDSLYPTTTPVPPARISGITTNIDDYPGQAVPQFEKFELTFQVETAVSNPQFPYVPSPPPGIEPEIGISVDAHFTPDNWKTVYYQPAFYYQDYQTDVRSDAEWVYPTDRYAWKVRFAPDTPGDWQVKLTMVDKDGRFETDPITFAVAPSANHGNIQVSAADPRYFEFTDGTFFLGQGINMELPGNLDQFPIMAANGMNVVRTYLPSQYAIWGAAWSPWRSVGAAQQGQETNARLRHALRATATDAPDNKALAVPDSELFLWLSHDETVFGDGQQWRHVPCAVIGWNTPQISVERDTNYRLRMRYRLQDLTGPQVAERPFGLTIKTAHWLWDRSDETQRCTYPGTGDLLAASYAGENGRWQNNPDPDNPDWFIMESTFNSGAADFLPRLWLAIENATAGNALIDTVWIEAAQPDGTFGPNIVYKASMANHLYFDQRSSFAFDQALSAAEANDITFKLVVMEKGDYALNIFNDDGTLTQTQPIQGEARLFYGNGRSLTKIRWLQQAWWRYLQARWGYSTAIHSWELVNEGSPSS
ncbi:MAG: hypothetical protein KC421_02610, partial [Anaerolineales bacterium]|nr:hypothetical protein [Anaerolineales bacterium]